MRLALSLFAMILLLPAVSYAQDLTSLAPPVGVPVEKPMPTDICAIGLTAGGIDYLPGTSKAEQVDVKVGDSVTIINDPSNTVPVTSLSVNGKLSPVKLPVIRKVNAIGSWAILPGNPNCQRTTIFIKAR